MTDPTPNALVVVGTRPEAIKLAPVIMAFDRLSVPRKVVLTGQHLDLAANALAEFSIEPDRSLTLSGSTLTDRTANLTAQAGWLIEELRPRVVVVQGDTTSALAYALAGFLTGVPVAHVEAGLRTGDLRHPFPEEANRQIIDRLSEICFAATAEAMVNLQREGIAESSLFLTGNTIVDAVLWAAGNSHLPPAASNYVLVTLHRRESAGEPFAEIIRGLYRFLNVDSANRSAVWPLHHNPAVMEAISEAGPKPPNLSLVPPMGYLEFVRSIAGARSILSDSGGVQEEAPTFGTPVIVCRESTERPEAVSIGQNVLAGRTSTSVLTALEEAWARPTSREIRQNPFGDGKASDRIADHLAERYFHR